MNLPVAEMQLEMFDPFMFYYLTAYLRHGTMFLFALRLALLATISADNM